MVSILSLRSADSVTQQAEVAVGRFEIVNFYFSECFLFASVFTGILVRHICVFIKNIVANRSLNYGHTELLIAIQSVVFFLHLFSGVKRR